MSAAATLTKKALENGHLRLKIRGKILDPNRGPINANTLIILFNRSMSRTNESRR